MTNSSVLSQSPTPTPYESLTTLLKRLKLGHFLSDWQTIEHRATQENWSYAQFLLALAEGEASRRDQARIARALSEAQLPCGKSWSNFEFSHVPSLNPAAIMQFAQTTDWLNTASNILFFGASGTGKTHCASALAYSIIELGKRVKFLPATTLVQQLQQAKLQLQLPAFLVKLDKYDLLILDDLGYVKKSEAETSVLFELIAHRYERRSLLITANQPFSQWESIFTDSMMTVAAIDRLIHHATIFEMKAESFRKQEALARSHPA
ncbi:IS21-like element helper ATPase IstB [Leptolyngbya sp. AN03gr2]|uniref:IS21-like element helper ATPase IstB n=1 Tax=unclassified Leptolyngbya TaxID=2650499 RepID=UPI003D310F00